MEVVARDGAYLVRVIRACETGRRSLLPRISRCGLQRVFMLVITASVSLLSSAPAFAQSDTIPPNLLGMTLSPSTVDVTAGSANITISLTLTDNLSGVTFGYPFLYDEFTLVSPSGRQVIVLSNGGGLFTLVGGTSLNGVWQRTLTIPQFSEAGKWTVGSLTVPDVAQNRLILNTAQLAAVGFATTVNVASTADTTPPTLEGLSFSPSSIDVSNASQPVTVSLNLNDVPAGVVFPGGNQIAFDFLITSPSGKQTQYLGTTQFVLKSGTPQSGVWQATLVMPQHSEAGVWTIQQLLLQDAAHNTETLNAVAIQALGLSPFLTVADQSPDTTPPQIEGLTFAPQFLDTSSGPQTVTVTLNLFDNLSGVSFAPTSAVLTFAYGPFFQNPARNKTIFGSCSESNGTPQNGTWRCTITVPPFADAGAWVLTNISLKDAVENTINYAFTQLQALGFPVVLNINQSTGGGSGTGRASAVAAFFGGAGSTVNPTALVAEPVNSATGNYVSRHIDLTVRGRGLSFQWIRYYNSLDAYSGPVGLGWTHSYNVLLTENSQNGQVTIKQGDGSTISFVPIGGGRYGPKTTGLFDTLVKRPDGSFILTRKNQVSFTFTQGQLSAIADRNANTQALAYDSKGDLISVTDTVGRVFRLDYDNAGRVIALTDPTGRMIRYTYDGSGNLATCQDPIGGVTRYGYDNNNLLITGTDPRNVVYVQNTYDANERVVLQKNGRSFPTTFSYSPSAPTTTTVVDPLGHATQYVYDGNTRLIQVINAASGTTSFLYDANNNRTTVINPTGHTTLFSYDSSGNITRITNALGNASTFTYDTLNNPLTATTPAGSTSRLVYDSHGNLATTRDALGQTTSFTHDGFGQLASWTDAAAETVSLTYDGEGNIATSTNAFGTVTRFASDAIGRLISITDGNGHTTAATYDGLSRFTKLTDALGHSAQLAYDAAGNITTRLDANGHPTTYQFDGANNLLAVTDATSHITTYSYDGNNNRQTFTNASGKVTSYSHDVLNRQTKAVDPLGRSTSYSYDALDNIVAVTDGTGRSHSFSYDALSRPLGRTYADGNVIAFSYDVNNNRTSMSDAHGVSHYVYDALNRITSVTSPDGSTVGYSYDAVSRRTALTYPDGRLVSYGYDLVGRLSTVNDGSGNQTNYGYDAAGNHISTFLGNGTSTAYAFDHANRLIGVVNGSHNHILSSFAYTLDSLGNRLSVVDAAGAVSQYSYNSLNQLISWLSPSGSASYIYDNVGNRVALTTSTGTTAYMYDAANELVTAGTTVFTYDGNGNLLTRTNGPDVLNYTFDALNRLTDISGSGSITHYAYDGANNRVSQQVGTGSYSYVLDVARRYPSVLAEHGPDGAIAYVYGIGLVSERIPKGDFYYQFDGVENVVTVTNHAGAHNANYAYDPWGLAIRPTTPPIGLDALGTSNKFRFSGEALDPGTGLYYLRARYYDPSVGRFISRDPFHGMPRAPQTANGYAYALNNPLHFVDHSGLAAEQGAFRSGAIYSAIFSVGISDTTVSGVSSFGPPPSSQRQPPPSTYWFNPSPSTIFGNEPPWYQPVFQDSFYAPCDVGCYDVTSSGGTVNVPYSPPSPYGGVLPPYGTTIGPGDWTTFGGSLGGPSSEGCDPSEICNPATGESFPAGQGQGEGGFPPYEVNFFDDF
jgi:RHS repeat-associated protein